MSLWVESEVSAAASVHKRCGVFDILDTTLRGKVRVSEEGVKTERQENI